MLMSWSVAGGEACADAVSIGSCMGVMVVKCRIRGVAAASTLPLAQYAGQCRHITPITTKNPNLNPRVPLVCWAKR